VANIYRTLIVEKVGAVSIIKLNDPETMNAASLEMVEELISAFDRESLASRAILLTGAGRGFCSGANLGGTLNPEEPGYDAGLYLETHYNRLMLAIRALLVPIITAVNGPAAGIGAAIALAGDMIISGRSGYFLQAFARIGLVPDGGSAFLLIQAVGRPRAMEMMLLGERTPASTALDWGLINRVVADEDLLDEALALATKLADGPTVALGMMRRLAWASMDSRYDELLNREREFQRDAGRTPDHREGVAAFFEKRPSRFVGR
jgi:2-(1,2-epoxy-1,2-dihydrophenyl)acetyl-CoA isomerase